MVALAEGERVGTAHLGGVAGTDGDADELVGLAIATLDVAFVADALATDLGREGGTAGVGGCLEVVVAGAVADH